MRPLAALALLAFPAVLLAQPKAKALPMAGEARPEFEAVDKLMLQMLRESSAPGCAVAIAKDGRLVYARGYGHADADKKTPVQPTSLFRIASVSKAITLAGICQLVERGKLHFDDRVFDVLKLKSTPKMDPRWKQITIEHLWHHKGGFDSEGDTDPMFHGPEIARDLRVPSPPTPDQTIQWMLNRPLAFDPGEKERYSNFGYCLLGRVIEKAGGKPYEKYVNDEVLKPIGIRDMQIGKTLTAAKGEVRYVETDPPTALCVFAGSQGKRVPTPYGAWCLETMDSCGGWIASAIDLARFGAALDDTKRFPALGGAASRKAFFPDFHHFGANSGTSALFHHTPRGLSYAVLFNSRKHRDGEELCHEVEKQLKSLAAEVKSWPDGDLFPKYLK